MFRSLALGLCALALVAGLPSSGFADTRIVPLAEATGDQQPMIITLRDGTRVRFLNAFEHTVEGGGPQDRALAATFAFEDKTILSDHAKLIEIADFLFGAVVVVPADTRGFKRAWVGFLVAETTVGDNTVQELEDFHYARGENAVWLRQAGPEPWKTAQDAKDWTPPDVEIVDLGQYGTAEVTFFGEIASGPNFKALGIEMRTDTSMELGRKWEEIRALWHSLDREKLKADGFTLAVMQNYTEKARGKFHVRRFAFIRVARRPDGEWAKLPEGPLGPDGRPAVIASLPPLPMPESDALGLAVAAVLKAASPTAAPEVEVDSSAGSGTGLRNRAVERRSGKGGPRLKSYRARER